MQKFTKHSYLILPLFFIIILFFSIPLITSPQVSSTGLDDHFNIDAQASINMSSLEAHIRNLTSWSRVTTYPGFENASKYIYDFFNQLNLTNVNYENYSVVLPVDHGANLTILDPTTGNVTAFPLVPNEVQASPTPPQGIEGDLIYTGNGDILDFNGKTVAGNIVLMEFNSDKNWVNTLTLGAKAVVFIMPNSTDRYQAELKKLNIPIYIPRVLVSQENGEYLKSLIQTYGSIRVRLHSSMAYEERTAKNIVGFIEGTDSTLRDEIVVLAAHFDSMSVVPSLAPGAQDATSIASLMELANYFTENGPKRTLMFVALSGHYQSLAGARYFTERYFINSTEYENIGKKIKIFIDLDMSTDSQYVGVYYSGFFYYVSSPATPGYSHIERFTATYNTFGSIIEDMAASGVMDAAYLEQERSLIVEVCGSKSKWETTQSGRFILDSEPLSIAGITGLSFRTAYSPRVYLKTPFDTFESIVGTIGNLEPQLTFTFTLLDVVVNRETIAPILRNNPARTGGPNRASFAKLIGQVVIWNNSLGRVSNATEALLPQFIIYIKNTGWPLLDHNFVVKTDEKGVFSVYGLITPVSGMSSGYGLEAYVINQSGAILYASDVGKFSGDYSSSFSISAGQLGTEDTPRPFLVFQCGTIAVYDCLMPNTLNPDELESASFSYDVLKISDRSQPDSFNIISDGLGETLLFVPNFSIMFTMKTGGSFPSAFLTNASSEYPDGVGYKVPLGGFLNLNGTALRFANDMYWSNEGRINRLHQYTIYNTQAEEYHNLTLTYIQRATEALKAEDYDLFRRLSLKAFSIENSAYQSVRGVFFDVINTTIFFFVTLIPFSMLVERLLFKSELGLRRAIAVVGIFVFFTLILFFLHPGFRLAANVYMILLGFVIVVLTMPVLIIVVSDAVGYISKFRVKAVGKHFTEISRLGAALMAFGTGIENMRRRRLRTGLTFVTVVIITLALVSFTSTSTFTIIRIPSYAGKTMYNGLLIERTAGSGNLPLGDQLQNYVTNEYGADAITASRAWIYPSQTYGLESPSISLYNVSYNVPVQVSAIMGMMPEENNITGIGDPDNPNYILISGRWFNQTDYYSCILSDVRADLLRVSVGDVVFARGFKLTVIGIFNASRDVFDQLIQLDEESITPVFVQRIHETPSAVMMVPFRLARWGGMASFITAASGTYQTVMKFENTDKIVDSAKDIANHFSGVDIFAGRDGTIWRFKKFGAFMIEGWTLLTIPAIIAVFTIFSVMLGGVYERKKEVSTYSALGLSPMHVALMFLAESVTYSVLAAVVGYTLGITVVSLLPGLQPNYSASYVLLAVGFSMLAIMASTLYPARQAARLVTPSLARKWELTTKPKGDEWVIPMPFAATEKEAQAVLVFVSEFLDAHRVERAGVFSSSRTSYGESERDGTKVRGIRATVSIAPWEAAIQQKISVNAFNPPKEERWSFELYLKRTSGHPKKWATANRKFIDIMRKQLLIWRGLSPAEKKTYIDRSSKLGKSEK